MHVISFNKIYWFFQLLILTFTLTLLTFLDLFLFLIFLFFMGLLLLLLEVVSVIVWVVASVVWGWDAGEVAAKVVIPLDSVVVTAQESDITVSLPSLQSPSLNFKSFRDFLLLLLLLLLPLNLCPRFLDFRNLLVLDLDLLGLFNEILREFALWTEFDFWRVFDPELAFVKK